MASEPNQASEENESILTSAPRQAVRPFVRVLEGIGSCLSLLFEAARHLPTLPRQFGRFIEQCYLIGYTTLPIVAILSFFIGSVV
jgi:phospholipid/cholesterol/gamma-HCH transport system permease protein